ncbi:hypothetical protein CTKZ_01400 [Cellulomonas algicola]|uniref:Serine acetyltransferase n=1 Tax=Cellulomonas algicola TaxID=2071633 RepID=A0A401UV84_9CELL|nr:DapH/DapD/GlmU-related protein [Cellulomonas algicola]GCD18578.1 hypothetical protein CTKZ_01400 [Cellulomonas algicola]
MEAVEMLVRLRLRPGIGRVANAALHVLGVDFPASVRVGPGLALPHGAVGLVVHEDTVIGANVKIYQGVTIGRSDTHLTGARADGGRVVVEDDVVIGAGAVVLFRSGSTTTIGRGAVVGANAVVLRSVPPGEIWAGNPARPTRRSEPSS